MFNGGMGNMQGMMKKVQKLQADMAKMQEELKLRTIETTVGGGAVTVVVSGKKKLSALRSHTQCLPICHCLQYCRQPSR